MRLSCGQNWDDRMENGLLRLGMLARDALNGHDDASV
jgi:hypothetical protein